VALKVPPGIGSQSIYPCYNVSVIIFAINDDDVSTDILGHHQS
jgi:hypothetical protein